MKKIGRNDPCPCGSGKKYKHCCLGITDDHKGMNQARNHKDEVEELLSNREFDSLEELQIFVDSFTEKKNKVSQIDFLGFSSEQIHRLLHHPMESLEDMVRFNRDLNPEVFHQIPVVKNAQYFLTRLKELEPLRTTAKGNLPLAFTRELHDTFVDSSNRYRYRIRSEEESLAVNTLRHVLKMCGWLKKIKKQYSLTKKGTRLIERGFSGEHFFTLLNVFTRRFNWAFQDGHPEYWIIQGSFVFSLFLLHRKAQEYISDEALGDFFIRTFPAALAEDKEVFWREPADAVKRCFSLRFLERFCEYFGFADIQRKKKEPYGFHLFIKKSAFYDQYIQWSND